MHGSGCVLLLRQGHQLDPKHGAHGDPVLGKLAHVERQSDKRLLVRGELLQPGRRLACLAKAGHGLYEAHGLVGGQQELRLDVLDHPQPVLVIGQALTLLDFGRVGARGHRGQGGRC